MKLTQKAQQLIEYMLLVAAVVAGVLGVAGPHGPMQSAVEKSLNRAVETIYGDVSWSLGDYSDCSVLPSCGNGTQTRTVTCKDSGGNIVDDGQCAAKGSKPPLEGDCYIACGGNHWVGSGFGPCSAACGDGTATQTVECQDADGNKIAASDCVGAPPATSKVCSNGPCFAWHAGGCIGDCNVSCGIGQCPSSVTCQDTQTNEVVGNGKCNLALKPPGTSDCNTGITCEYQWHKGDWTECDQSCDNGFKHRVVECRKTLDGVVVDDDKCTPPKPDEQEVCNLGPCNHWGVVGDWTECSKPCNPGVAGTQDANIKCLDKNNTPIADGVCDASTRPSSTRNCNLGACTWVTDLNYGDCNTTCGIGTQSRNAWCIQAGFPAPRVAVSWCISMGDLAPPQTCPDVNGIACTQSKPCSGTSTCCGNNVKDNYPSIPYSEGCDDGVAGNGACPKTCSNGCTLNACPCTFAAGATWGTDPLCTAPAKVVVASGSSDCAYDITPPAIGSVCAYCNNGKWEDVDQLCGESCKGLYENCKIDSECCSGSCAGGKCRLIFFRCFETNQCSSFVYDTAQECQLAQGKPCYETRGECVANASTDCGVTTVNGQCGTADGGSFSSPPPVGQRCSAGTEANFATGANNYTWQCTGSGSPVGTTDLCSATRTSLNCQETTHTNGKCSYPISLLANGESDTFPTNTVKYEGSVKASCSNGSPSYSNEICCGPSPDRKLSNGGCKPSCGLLLSEAGYSNVGLGCSNSSCAGRQAGVFQASYDCNYCCENFAAPSCGDKSCNGSETCVSCPGDCGACSSCTYPKGSPWGECISDSLVSAVHGAEATALDWTGKETGSKTATCNNGKWGPPESEACYTCSDGIKNQLETGVDCGGPCPACADTGASCNVPGIGVVLEGTRVVEKDWNPYIISYPAACSRRCHVSSHNIWIGEGGESICENGELKDDEKDWYCYPSSGTQPCQWEYE